MGEGVGSFLPPLVVQILGDSKELTASLAEASGASEDFSKKTGSSLDKLASVGKAALFGIATAAVGLGLEAVHLADKWETAHASMVAAIKATGASYTAFQKPIAAVDARMANLGYTNADTEAGMASLVTATGSTSKALKLMSVTADVARVKNISLSQAGILVAKASEGQSRAIKALGINLNAAAGGARQLVTAHRSLVTAEQNTRLAEQAYNAAGGKTLENEQSLVKSKRALTLAQKNYNDVSKSGSIIIGALSQKLGGQASAYAATFTGRMEVLKAKTEDLGKNIGVALIPKLESLVNWTMKVIGWFQKHTATAKVLAGVIGGVLSLAIGAYIAKLTEAAAKSVAKYAQMMASAAKWAAEQVAAFAGWVAEQTAALAESAALWSMYAAEWVAKQAAAAAEWVATQSAALATVAAEWLSSLAAMATAAAAWAAEMLAAGVEALLPFAPIIAAVAVLGVAAYELYKHWNDVWSFIKRITNDAWNFLKPIFTWIKSTFLQGIELEAQALQSTWNTVWGAIRSVVTDVWNFLAPIFSKIKDVGLTGISTEIDILKGIWNAAWNGIQTVVQGVWSVLKPIFDAIASAASKVAGTVGKVVGIASKITGGAGRVLSDVNPFAEGTDFAPGGLAIVGEKGPELVTLPRGASVTTAAKTKQLRAGNGGVTPADSQTKKLIAKYTPKSTPEPLYERAFQGVSDGLIAAIAKGLDHHNKKAVASARRDARALAASEIVGTGKNAHHLSHSQQVKAVRELMKQSEKQHQEDMQQRAEAIAAAKVKRLAPKLTREAKSQAAFAAKLTAQALGGLSAKSAHRSVQESVSQVARARALDKATKGLADHQAAVTALKAAIVDETTARKNALRAAQLRNYQVSAVRGSSSNAASYLGATAAQPTMVHAVLNLDGQTVYDVVQKHALRTSRRNGVGVGNGLAVAR